MGDRHLFSSFVFLLLLLTGTQAAAQKLNFSPNGDGIKDRVTFKLQMQENVGISSWLFEIKDQPGALVKSFSGKGKPPSELEWDGKDFSNRLVPDGSYLFSLSLVTPAGNQVAIAPSPVEVDRVVPQVSAAVEPSIFSPNGDGVKDETQFSLQATDAIGIHSWILILKDREGAPARNIAGKGSPPGAVRWDGRGDFEEDVPDGTYTFELTVHDLAGNKRVTPAQSVTINRAGQVSTVDVVPMLISPNGDGVKDEVSFRIQSAAAESVERWVLNILNRNGKVIHSFSGLREPPPRITWSGLLGPKKPAPDGPYQVALSETDRAGNTSATTPQPLEIDTSPPLLEARLEPNLLSPNGDKVRDQGTFHLKAEDVHPLEEWKLVIANDVGTPVKTLTGQPGSKPLPTMTWGGEGQDGTPLIDGTYTYELQAKDIGGNRSLTPKAQLRIDRAPPLVTVSAESQLFSPNADGVLDELAFNVAVQDASPLESWSLNISDSKGKLVRAFTGPPGSVAPRVLWDGRNQDRVLLPDGEYGFVLSAKDIAGNSASSPEAKVTVGAGRPGPEVASDLGAISPNADGFKDFATFGLKVQAFNRIKEWTFRISDKAKTAHRTLQGRGDVPGSLQWKGEADDKRALPDGEYAYELSVVDEAGNRVSTPTKPIRVDTAKPVLAVQVSPNLFSPNGDGMQDEAVFIPSYRDASPIAEWTIAILDSSKKTVRVFTAPRGHSVFPDQYATLFRPGELPLSFPWKGRTEGGTAVPDGEYTYTFAAVDEVGNKSVTAEQIVKVDNSAPQVSLQAEPVLFSPNGDGVKDETMFLLEAKDASDFARWKLLVQGKGGAARTFSGLGRPPRSFPWDGKNDRGNINPDGVYAAVLEVTDEVGNTGKTPELHLTLDTSRPMVTVTAETDTLEELVPQMQVAQTEDRGIVISLSSEVLFDTGQSVIKAQAYSTLMKAVHLVRRYPQRQVRIEGHADNVPIRNDQFRNNLELSQGRARAILDFFADKGNVEKSRMAAQGFGDTRAKTSNATEEGRRLNRRVEIILLKEKGKT